jgi:hypothetical protein
MPTRFLELTECYQQMLGGEPLQTYVRPQDIRMFSAAQKMEVFEDNVDKIPRTELWVQLAADRATQLFVLEPPYLILGWLEEEGTAAP